MTKMTKLQGQFAAGSYYHKKQLFLTLALTLCLLLWHYPSVNTHNWHNFVLELCSVILNPAGKERGCMTLTFVALVNGWAVKTIKWKILVQLKFNFGFGKLWNPHLSPGGCYGSMCRTWTFFGGLESVTKNPWETQAVIGPEWSRDIFVINGGFLSSLKRLFELFWIILDMTQKTGERHVGTRKKQPITIFTGNLVFIIWLKSQNSVHIGRKNTA